MKKTIILDFDGTIADTFKVSIEIAHSLTGHESLINPKEINELKHDSMIEVAEKLEIPKRMWPFLLYKGRRQMSKRLGEIKPFSGMEEVLSSLHKDGYRIFIMSTNSNRNISKFLSAHGMRGYIRKIYGGVGILSKSGALRKVMKKNRLTASDVIYVGDEVRDIEASKSVDVPVIAVTWGFNDIDRLTDEDPMAVVKTCPDLLKVLEAWESA